MSYIGDYNINSIVRKKWSTTGTDSNSITRATDGTLKIYKDDSATQRTSLSGVTQIEDFGGDTGVHSISIDLSDNTDAGFYASGHDYDVVMSSMTIDGKTVNAPIMSFSIQNRSDANLNTTQSWDGITTAKLYKALIAMLAGKVVVTDNGSTKTLSFKAQDGSSEAFSITAAEFDGARDSTGTIS